MKIIIFVTLLVSVVVGAPNGVPNLVLDNVRHYHKKIGVPLAKALKEQEERISPRVIDGSIAVLGEIPYQAGLLSNLSSGLLSMASASLISNTRVLTAAHYLEDQDSFVVSTTVVLGSVNIFNGGVRVSTSDFVLHPEWDRFNIANDIAIIRIQYVPSGEYIRPIALPSGAAVQESFSGQWAIVSGFGKILDIPSSFNQQLYYVWKRVISNEECIRSFGAIIRNTNVCAQGEGIKNVCSGDSGGPLAVQWGEERIVVGVVSFGAAQCVDIGPAGYARVTEYLPWIQSLL